ncbi:hypothetical protein H6P81_010720 [Aristolochia fimbriata]|uniref:Uncharacterized protein n=1 Tax=Aristolochia fimbriata TaxID=158543 RepID=A0AAV7EPK6_ARIFI|nr:hypothetical protein H6P81_010720 [Aristolochia fimbriata]
MSSSMDVEAASGVGRSERGGTSSDQSTAAPNVIDPKKKKIRWGLLLTYTAFMAVGSIGGPLLQRLYFVHGGSRKWLSSCLQTIGFPFMFLPLFYLYARRFGRQPAARKLTRFFMGPKLFFASVFMGMLLGADNYLYSAGLAYLPVSTSSLLFATQLAFTALFAFLLVRQKFTFYSVNSVMLMTLGALVLALHTSKDRPPGVSSGEYFMGFFFTLGGAVLLGFILPSIELCYAKAGQAVTYALVMQFQIVFTLSATVLCLVGMAINNDFEVIPREAKEFAIGEAKYYLVIILTGIVWQFLFIGTLGVVYCSSSLFAGILSSVLLPLTQVGAVIAFDEKFTGEKGMSLALCLWGFTSYFIGEYKRAGRQVPSIEPEEVEVEGEEANRGNYKPSKETKLTPLLLNYALLALGNTGGPLLLRLYFIRGGSRLWFSSSLLTAGWAIMFIPLCVSYFYRRSSSPEGKTKLFFITPNLFMVAASLGIILGCIDYMYAYGCSYVPVTTSSLLMSTQLMFNAIFAFFVVKQRFSSYSINSVFLMTLGAIVLGLHTNRDRPANETHLHYILGFFMTLGAAFLYGIMLPLLQLAYSKAKQEVTYTLVIEVQMVMSFFATAFCVVGLLANSDYKAIAREVSSYRLGEAKYVAIVVCSAIMWQLYFLGMVGVVSCSSSLHAGVMEASLIPLTQMLAVVFFHERFTPEKGVSLALCLWGFSSYFYGERKKEMKERRKKQYGNETLELA